jgi:heme-degrading monooxygenase HmoA
MAITVMIQRTFEEAEKASQLAPLIVKLRSLATIQTGYITGKTFRCLDCPGEYLVISTWNSLRDWERWLNSDERTEIQKQIDDLLGYETEYRIYEPLVGGIVMKS